LDRSRQYPTASSISARFRPNDRAIISLPGQTSETRRDAKPPIRAGKSRNPLTLQMQALALGEASSMSPQRHFSRAAESHPVPSAYTSDP